MLQDKNVRSSHISRNHYYIRIDQISQLLKSFFDLRSDKNTTSFASERIGRM